MGRREANENFEQQILWASKHFLSPLLLKKDSLLLTVIRIESELS